MKLLREYIRTLLKEAPDMGDVIWGSDERDTEYENQLWQFFGDHFDDEDAGPLDPQDPSLIDNIRAYMSDPRYNDILRPYQGNAYRGMLMDIRELIPILLTGDWEERPGPNNIDDWLDKEYPDQHAEHEVSWTFIPSAFAANTLFSHWTKDVIVADKFASQKYHRGRSFDMPIEVVMKAQSGQTFLDAKGLYDIKNPQRAAFGGYSDEKEVIGMGPIDVGMVMIRKPPGKKAVRFGEDL